MNVTQWFSDRSDRAAHDLLFVDAQIDPMSMAIQCLLDTVVHLRMHLEKNVSSPSRWAIVFLVIDDIQQLMETGTLNGEFTDLQDGSVTRYFNLLVMLIEISKEDRG